jgi:hypothetical protein
MKSKNDIVVYEELSDLDGLILDGMARNLMEWMLLVGSEDNRVFIEKDGEKIFIDMEIRDPNELPEERMTSILAIARVTAQEQSIDLVELIQKMLKADGWSVTEDALRTPLWMIESREFDRHGLSRLEGMAWLDKCTSLKEI